MSKSLDLAINVYGMGGVAQLDRDREIAELIKSRPENSKLRENLREGISLRDHFAGLAMQVLLVDATSMNNAASNSYDMADLMLAERERCVAT